ncbi:DUF177 domain-containing protein [Patulibacter brassicae]|jgi:uncharacterized protein|uniref:DUF177 domain-containing protein n=1 Tax=Patulibacter brassicae TaxID=1705717 RepID=A0ABU4VF93_9ACTN|nr:DUF177 domain-containing protein [Patulibacter brassicae]MDX8150458.1 DUF177 domain-containing protein [Patulibacter brassicae]
MAAADPIVLSDLRMVPGEGRRLDVPVPLDAVRLSEQGYAPEPAEPTVHLDIARMVGGGYALRLRFAAGIAGPCMRCLEPTSASVEVDARELSQASRDEEEQFESDYVDGDEVDLARWANDSFVLGLPARVLCREACKGLCPECGANLNEDPDHRHDRGPDPRWAALGSLRFDDEGQLVDERRG